MVKKLTLVLLLLVFVSGVWAFEDTRPTPTPKEEDAGYVLLGRLIGMFQDMAATGSGGRDKIDPVIEGIMADTKKALSEKRIDHYFFRHFQRILLVIKLTIVEDKEGILAPLIDREAREFVADMMGTQSAQDSSSIGVLAMALQNGILNIQLYLDTKEQRKKLSEEWEKKFAPDSQKIKK